MKRSIVMAGLTVALFALALGTSAHGAPRPPLVFEANRGQTDSEVRFLGRGDGYTFFLTSNAAVLALHRSKSERAVVRMTLVGADPSPAIVGEAELPGQGQLLQERRSTAAGHERSDLCPREVRRSLSGRGPRVPQPRAAARIRLHRRPRSRPGPDHAGLRGRRSRNGGRPRRPRAAHGGRRASPTQAGHLPGGRRDPSRDLRRLLPRGAGAESAFASAPTMRLARSSSTPILDFSTFLGGSGDERDELYGDLGVGAVRVAVDTAGNAYVTGTTASTDFPTTPGEDGIMDGEPRRVRHQALPHRRRSLLDVPRRALRRHRPRHRRGCQRGNAYVTGRATTGAPWRCRRASSWPSSTPPARSSTSSPSDTALPTAPWASPSPRTATATPTSPATPRARRATSRRRRARSERPTVESCRTLPALTASWPR